MSNTEKIHWLNSKQLQGLLLLVFIATKKSGVSAVYLTWRKLLVTFMLTSFQRVTLELRTSREVLKCDYRNVTSKDAISPTRAFSLNWTLIHSLLRKITLRLEMQKSRRRSEKVIQATFTSYTNEQTVTRN
jgi:hypothetical protein